MNNYLLQYALLFCIVQFTAISCGPPPPKKTVEETSVPSELQPAKLETVQQSEWDAAYFIHEMMDMKRLAKHHPGQKLVSYSSHDPNNGSVDAGIFVDTYTENNKTWRVMAQEKGPGVISRILMSNKLEGEFRIYLDHQSEPVIRTTFQELYSLQNPFFQLYFAFDPVKSGDTFVNFFPIPFKEHCMIVTDTETAEMKYDINILKLPEDSPITSFNGKMDSRLENAMNDYIEFIKSNAVGKYEQTVINQFVSHEIKAGESKLIINDTGPGAIEFFALQLEPITADTISLTRIKMYWDDLKEPAVDIPVRDFFCSNIGVPNSWNSLPMGFYPKTDDFKNGFYYCQFYMPFQKKCQILIENQSTEPLRIKFARKVDFSPLPEDPLYFYARNDERAFAMGLIHSLFEFEGKGNFVGFNLSAMVDVEMSPQHFFLEGDPYYFVDGEKYASIQNAGLDNYFGSDHLLAAYTPFWLPSHGNMYNKKDSPAVFHTYRFHGLDAIPFSSSLMYIQEIGCPIQFVNSGQSNTIPVQCRWTCYWYGKLGQPAVPRQESVYYYNIQGEPHPKNPVMIDLQVYLQLPPGKWMMNYAPVWDLTQVYQQEYNVQ